MPESSASLPTHPNLLLIITDQERATRNFPPDWEQKNLPTMTRLKARGLSFKNAFTNACMCSSSRSTMVTSLYPAQHGVTDTLSYGGVYSVNDTALDPTIPNLATMLRKGGYQVHYRGKWHLCKSSTGTAAVTPADVALYGFDGWIPPDAGQDTDPAHFGGGYANHDAPYIQQAIEFLQSVDRSKPFCLVLSLVNPHDVLSYPLSYNFGYDKEDLIGDIGLPSNANEKLLENYKPSAQEQLLLAMDSGLGILRGDDEKRRYINFYGNLLKKIDGEIGRVIDVLDAPQGDLPPLAESTWVVRIADHGEMGMAHGGLRQKAFNVYEETLNVPLVFSNPVHFPPSDAPRVTTQMASLIDILPTLSSLLDVPAPDGLKGVDLASIVQSGNTEGDDSLQSSILFTFDDIRASNGNVKQVVAGPDRIRCIREQRWKYAHYFKADSSYPDEYEMYDLEQDPTEMENFGNPNHPRYNDPVIAKERDRLAAALAEREAALSRETKVQSLSAR
jgi:choline-sulfatase